jgi:hypothetical protein
MFPVNLCILSELKSESVSEINRNSVRIEIGIGVRNEPEQSLLVTSFRHVSRVTALVPFHGAGNPHLEVRSWKLEFGVASLLMVGSGVQGFMGSWAQGFRLPTEKVTRNK